MSVSSIEAGQGGVWRTSRRCSAPRPRTTTISEASPGCPEIVGSRPPRPSRPRRLLMVCGSRTRHSSLTRLAGLLVPSRIRRSLRPPVMVGRKSSALML